MTENKPRNPQFNLKVQRSNAGLGLFAAEDIPKGRFIVEYWGKIVPDDVANRVAGRYLFELGNGRTILGSTRKNTARYANHSCRPNSEARQIGNRIFIWSTRNIKSGDPITYNYGKDYFEGYIKPHGCRCEKCL